MHQLKQIIRNIKLLVLDVDGVLTDGSLYYYKDGEAFKKFNVRDGQGNDTMQHYAQSRRTKIPYVGQRRHLLAL